MSPPTARSRPAGNQAATNIVQADEAKSQSTPVHRQNPPRHAVGAALRRRADAAHRLEPVDGRWGERLAARDPALTWPPAPRTPSTFGMTPDEIRHEAERLLSAGWGHWEIRCTLVDPEMVVAQ